MDARPRWLLRCTLLAAMAAGAACHRATASAGDGGGAERDHELHLPPAGPTVTVTFDGKSSDVALASMPHEGSAIRLDRLWRTVFPADDPSALHFDLVGADGFRPMSRPKCTRLLSGAELAAARIDVGTHDVSYDDGTQLPGCYRVKGVVRLEATR